MTADRSLHIAIDARWIFPKMSGIGHYTRELIRGLTRLDNPHRFTILFENPDVMARTMAETGLSDHVRFLPRLTGTGVFSPVNQWALPAMLRRLKVHIYHSTNYMMPLWIGKGIQRVVTIHDLIPLLFRDHAPKSRKSRVFPIYRQLMLEIGRRADAIIAVSESTRRDILQHLRIPPEAEGKVTVIPEGVDPRHRPLVPDRPLPADPVILYVGRRDPYKNLPLLIDAFALLRRRGVNARLRVIGPPDPRYPEAEDLARKHGIFDAIEWSGYVSEADLLKAYQQAAVYALPSRYEGFGLPVLEAMACGTPVVCSRTSSLPEVGGEVADYIDPLTAETCTDRIQALLSDPAAWAERSRAGIKHAATFSWLHTARETVRLYEALGEQRHLAPV